MIVFNYMKNLIKKLIPNFLLQFYYKSLAVFGSFIYGNPSNKMIVIGVTGTNGKSTTVSLISKALEAGGDKVGALSTVLFKVANEEKLNDKKMTMLGRFQLQKYLKKMVDAGCKYAVIETSSQGVEQYRHIAINYDYAVFTNLTPEHIEAHGGFENYKKAKGKFFSHLTKMPKKNYSDIIACQSESHTCHPEHPTCHPETPTPQSTLHTYHTCHPELVSGSPTCHPETPTSQSTLHTHHTCHPELVSGSPTCHPELVSGSPTCHPELVSGYDDKNKTIPKISIINIDDEHAEYFLNFPADKKNTFSVKKQADFKASDIKVSVKGTSFNYNLTTINLQLIGAFNVENSLPAIAIATQEGIEITKIKSALESVPVVPGRTELINQGQNFSIMVDYAPEPGSMKKLYETLDQIKNSDLPYKKLIHVLGSCGGGRDKARRPILGNMAGSKADIVIVTNEDPYDEDPQTIINQVADGAIEKGKIENQNLFKILDRRSAIERALSLAQAGDLVLLTGKGSERAMAVAGGKYIPWDDREVVRKLLKKQ